MDAQLQLILDDLKFGETFRLKFDLDGNRILLTRDTRPQLEIDIRDLDYQTPPNIRQFKHLLSHHLLGAWLADFLRLISNNRFTVAPTPRGFWTTTFQEVIEQTEKAEEHSYTVISGWIPSQLDQTPPL